MATIATPDATAAYAREHPLGEGHWRVAQGLTLSSVGFGSYLGEDTPEGDAAYEAAFVEGLRGGVNVLDTAANYRARRSERMLGRALRASGVPRERVLVTTKAGFVPHETETGLGPREFIDAEYVATGVITRDELVANCHVLSARYADHELGRSLDLMGLDAVDVWFLHNPETQLEAGVPWATFEERLRETFALLEERRREGRLAMYGLATWNGLRRPPGERGHLPLERILRLAEDVGGPDHGLRAIELPYNIAMPEAARAPTQEWRGRRVPLLHAARDEGMLVLGSATLLQGALLRNLAAPALLARLGASTPLEAALQFSRSTPGMTTALVGTGRPAHARENLEALRLPTRPMVVEALLGAG